MLQEASYEQNPRRSRVWEDLRNTVKNSCGLNGLNTWGVGDNNAFIHMLKRENRGDKSDQSVCALLCLEAVPELSSRERLAGHSSSCEA